MAQDSSKIWSECLESREKTSLCELCQGLRIAKLRPPNFYRHAENRAALQSSAKNCRLCAIIERAIWRDGGGKDHGPQLHFDGAVDIGEERADSERDSWAVKLALVPDDWAEEEPENRASKPASGFAYVAVWLKTKHMATDLHLVVEEGDPLGRHGCAAEGFHVSGRTIASQDVPHDALFDVVRSWMHNCSKRHKLCAPGPAPWDESPLLPTRVIDVTRDGLDPRLVVTGGQRGHYAALSHCWGGLQLLQTKAATLARYQDNIPMHELPKSFKDAITIARKLQIPFLWIDSLCIVQDSEQDWHHEYALMSSIYRNSMLTISATGAVDGSRGCFIPEAHSEIVQLPQTFSDTDGKAYVTGSRLGSYGMPWADKVASGPLFRRAWALQERCLSRRILHCCQGQWVWECCEKIEAQFGFSEERSNAWHPAFLGMVGAMKRAYDGVYEFETNDDDDNDDDESEHCEIVMEDVEQHAAQRQLADQTVSSDMDTIKDEDSNIDGPEETALARLEDVHIERSRKEEGEEEEREPASRSFVVSLIDPPNGRSTYIVDLRPGADDSKPALKPTLLDRRTDSDLYDFLEVASRKCRYEIWYDLVNSYTGRYLTKNSDKLPAIAGLAAAIHEIAKDSYLAGHWRLELERSLFWRTEQEILSPEPARCHEYRAPSWAWPSMEGCVWWDWPDLSPGVGEAAPLKIVDVEVELVAGDENPFGPVAGGSLTVEGRTTWIRWDEDADAYTTTGNGFEDDAVEAVDPSRIKGMLIRNRRGENVGSWECDDTLNTVLPATKMVPGVTLEELRGRRIPFGGYSRWAKKAVDEIDPAERFTTLPPELLCLRGLTRYNRERIWADEPDEDEQEARYKIEYRIEALLLARTGDPSGKIFRRVGAAAFCCWDGSQEVAGMITIV
ncbi:hypothetical protein DHEL01_v201360 [Diaporthe helianthi]|uniref:Heterokaryon incompatibility domain-containing protein n=1 Tax=Diaporthe helianthi TaxID=158607 RepID=A0A2P5ICL5_DIAHE|nr:hypothetical protein DHEL01_v201360 [Diaporthe helianthi]